ncbi:MAG: hypothetical protein JRN20_16060 [Nitrososphaerota archaeon]|nr:hypothetical protein [Nitrososphaerota archaeon]
MPSLVIVAPFDEETVKRMNACTRKEFPICLDQALEKMIGEKEKLRLDMILMKGAIQNSQISSEKDIWNLYEKYLEQAERKFGKTVASVFEIQSLKEIESMLCTQCPVYINQLGKRSSREFDELV